MKIGIYHSPHDVGHLRDYQDILNDIREMAEFCDTAGFDNFWMGEHHFSIWGRELMPNPIIMATDIAARTRNLRVGLSAVVATLWHPLRLAEDLAMLDHLSNGRLEIAFARGNYGIEALNLNPVADPNNPDENFRAFDEAVKIVKTAFREEKFSFHGSMFTIPRPGFIQDRAHSVTIPEYIDAATGELVKLSVYPRPRQTPTPPLWQVVDSPRSIEYAAQNELGIIMWRPTVKTLKNRFELYRNTAAGSSSGIGNSTKTGILRDTFVARTDADAQRIAGDAVMSNLNFSNWRGPSIYLDPDEVLDPAQEAQLRKGLTYDFVKNRSLLFGSPEHVLAGLRTLRDEVGVDQVCLKINWVGLSHAATMESLRLIASDVLPALRADRAQSRGKPIP